MLQTDKSKWDNILCCLIRHKPIMEIHFVSYGGLCFIGFWAITTIWWIFQVRKLQQQKTQNGEPNQCIKLFLGELKTSYRTKVIFGGFTGVIIYLLGFSKVLLTKINSILLNNFREKYKPVLQWLKYNAEYNSHKILYTYGRSSSTVKLSGVKHSLTETIWQHYYSEMDIWNSIAFV